MKISSFPSLAAGVLSAVLAGPALADPIMVAGWDFSQFAFDGFLVVDDDPETFAPTLASNYSDKDPTDGAGAESAAFGTMYLDGSFGSTDMPLDFTDWFVPSAAASGSLTSNPSPGSGVAFDNQSVLETEGQEFRNPFVMTALEAATVVFEADLSSASQQGTGWFVTFAGKANTGTVDVVVQVSIDGVNFPNAGSALFTTTDQAFTFNLGAGPSEKAYARLVFSEPPSATQIGFLDNLSIHAEVVPEPGTAALLAAGLLGLARLGRRRA